MGTVLISEREVPLLGDSSMSPCLRFHPGRFLRCFSSLIAPAACAFKAYWLAIVTIQLAALSVVLAFYLVEGAEAFFTWVAELKASGGVAFAAGATVISSGLMPELLKRIFRSPGLAPPGPGELAHQFAMWAIVGIAVDAFYRLQAIVFGSGTDPATLLIKVVVDQLLFSPLLICGLIVNWFLLWEVQYDWRAWARRVRPRLFLERGLPLWATALSFWPIMLLIIYSLPTLLQFPLFLFANGAFSILLVFIARRQSAEALPENPSRARA